MLRCIAVHCGSIAEGLQTIVMLYGACGASSAPCGGVHHILSTLAIIAVHYGNVTESLWTTGTLADCTMVHCRNVSDALQTTGMLLNHCG